jgi:hypothetical protein
VVNQAIQHVFDVYSSQESIKYQLKGVIVSSETKKADHCVLKRCWKGEEKMISFQQGTFIEYES